MFEKKSNYMVIFPQTLNHFFALYAMWYKKFKASKHTLNFYPPSKSVRKPTPSLISADLHIDCIKQSCVAPRVNSILEILRDFSIIGVGCELGAMVLGGV